MPKLTFVNEPKDITLRKTAFDPDDVKRERKSKKNDSVWKDYGMMFVVPFCSSFQNEEKAVEKFWNQLRTFMLHKNFRKVLTDLMLDRMKGDKLAKALKEDNADYWKVIKTIEPTYIRLTSMDEILSNEAIGTLINMINPEVAVTSINEMSDETKQFYYQSGDFPQEISSMFST